jgi:hypothetical protein
MPRTMINAVLIEAQKIADVWAANPDFTLGNVKIGDFQEMVAELTAADALVEKVRVDLTAQLNDRDARLNAISDLITRAKSGIRAVYGPDSNQYEQAGGTRRSERKPRTHKLQPTP